MRLLRLLAVLTLASVVAVACGGDDGGSDAGGIRVVSPDDAQAVLTAPPDGLVVLDVRTLEEFEEGHLDGATMIDFYRTDFAVELDKLDKDAPYLIYCRSGNRSGQTRAIMEDLGFTDVRDIDGGAVAWADAGHALVAP